MGFDPGTLGSHPELKADAQALSHSGVPKIKSLRFLKNILLIHSEREREREREREAETQAEGEAGFTQGPDMGLDPGIPGSCPGLKAVLNRWATGAAQENFIFNSFFFQFTLLMVLKLSHL